MSRWPDNDVWEPREAYNRAPRPALIECEPLRNRCPRCMRVARWLGKFAVLIGCFVLALAFLFYFAS